MKINLLGASMDNLSLDKAVCVVAAMIEGGGYHFVLTLNPELLYQSQFDGALLEMINRAHLVTPDGAGIVWAAKVAGTPVPERVTGIDLTVRLIELASRKAWGVFFLGAAPGIAEKAAASMQLKHPGLVVAGTQHGYFTPDQEAGIINNIKYSGAKLLLVALGAPRQEKWIDTHLGQLGVSVSMGVGGSFDVLSGNVSRVPGWLQRLNLEWLGRLVMQPSRWRRMLVLPKFAIMVIKRYRLGLPGRF